MDDEVLNLHAGFLALDDKRLVDHARRLQGERVRGRNNMGAGMNDSIVIRGHRHMVHREVLNYIQKLERLETKHIAMHAQMDENEESAPEKVEGLEEVSPEEAALRLAALGTAEDEGMGGTDPSGPSSASQ